MDFTRRKAVLGLGMLAMGSGAAFTSAAFQSSTQPSADLRVVVEDPLRVRAGKAFRDGQETGSYGTVNNNYNDKFEIPPNGESFFDNNGLKDLDVDETPKATVNDKINDNLKIEVGVNPGDDAFADTNDLGKDKLRFPNILQVVNEGFQQFNIGILYDRNNTAFDPNGQYGEDVDIGGTPSNDITIQHVQHIYNFKVDDDDVDSSDLQISPDSGNNGTTTTNGFAEGDHPINSVAIGPGEIKNIHLDMDLTNLFAVFPTKDILIDKATDNNPFTEDLSVLDLLDGITVATDPVTTS